MENCQRIMRKLFFQYKMYMYKTFSIWYFLKTVNSNKEYFKVKLHLLKIPRASNNYLKPVYQSLSAKFPYPSNTKVYQCLWAPTLLNRPPIEVHVLSSDPTITKIYKSLNSVLNSKSINLRSKHGLEAGYWLRKGGDWGLD